MNDATAWIDPELVAAGKLLQRRGLVTPDRSQVPLNEMRAAADWIGASLGEGSLPPAREGRDDPPRCPARRPCTRL